MNTGDPVFSDGVRKVKTVTAADARAALSVQGTAEKGTANGYASLGADGKVPSAQLPALGGDPSAYIHAAAEKTPENNDEFTFVDSAASWVLRKIKWSSMVSIFSGLFSAVGHTHAGVYEPADVDIQAHVTGTGSPHTPAGIGAEVAGAAVAAVGSHESSFNHALLHNPVTVGEGLNLFGQHVTNTDLGSVAVTGHEEDYDHTKLHDPVTVSGDGLALVGQQVSLSIGSGATQVAAGNHLHAGVYDAAGEATGAVADHESEYDHSKLHDQVTVAGNGLTLFGQQVTLNVGAEIDHVASGIHEHSEYVEKATLTTAGDLLIQGASAPERLAIGDTNKVLTVVAGAPAWAAAAGGTVDRAINMFRLTLESGVAVSTTDQTAKTEVFVCPTSGGAATEAQITLHDGSAWVTRSHAQKSVKTEITRDGVLTTFSAEVTGLSSTRDLVVGMVVTVSGVGGSTTIASIDSASVITCADAMSNTGTYSLTFKCPALKNYDVFGYIDDDDDEEYYCLGPVWTSDTARATAITQKDGVPVLSGAFSVGGVSYAEGRLRHVGWARTTATPGQTECRFTATTTPARYLIGSVNNKVKVSLKKFEATDSWTHNTGGAWHQVRDDANNQIEFFIGESQSVEAFGMVEGWNGSAGPLVVASMIGEDGVSASPNANHGFACYPVQSWSNVMTNYRNTLTPGFHYLTLLELTASTGVTMYGDSTLAGTYGTGLYVDFMA